MAKAKAPKKSKVTNKAKKAAPKATPKPTNRAQQAKRVTRQKAAEEALEDEDEDEDEDVDDGVDDDLTDAAMLDPNAGLDMNFPGLNPADIKKQKQMMNDLARLKSGMPPMGANAYRATGETPILPQALTALFEAELARGAPHQYGSGGGATEEVRSFDLTSGQLRVRKVDKPTPATFFAAWDRIVLKSLGSDSFRALYEYRGFLFDLHLTGRAFDNIIEFDASAREEWKGELGVVVNITNLRVAYMMRYGFERASPSRVTKSTPKGGGSCNFYNKVRDCTKENCTFKHVCAFCASPKHGAHECPTKGTKRKKKAAE